MNKKNNDERLTFVPRFVDSLETDENGLERERDIKEKSSAKKGKIINFKYAPYITPFDKHDIFDEVIEKENDLSVLYAAYFDPDRPEYDVEVAMKICRDGVYYCKDGEWVKAEGICAPVFIGTAEEPTGMYIPNSLSYGGAIAAREFLQELIDEYDYKKKK